LNERQTQSILPRKDKLPSKASKSVSYDTVGKRDIFLTGFWPPNKVFNVNKNNNVGRWKHSLKVTVVAVIYAV
jgi:hypothetical protein